MTSKQALIKVSKSCKALAREFGDKMYKEDIKALNVLKDTILENEKLEKENKLFDETIDADDRIICQLTSELDTFKLAFYTLWKCCNSNDIATDVEETDNYLEFKCGYVRLCIPVTEQGIESIKKATELLDINVNEVLGE